MAVYRNTKTGIEFSSNCECKGADIVSVPDTHLEKKPATKPARKKPVKK